MIISRTIIILKHIDAKVLCYYSEPSRNSKKFHKKVLNKSDSKDIKSHSLMTQVISF